MGVSRWDSLFTKYGAFGPEDVSPSERLARRNKAEREYAERTDPADPLEPPVWTPMPRKQYRKELRRSLVIEPPHHFGIKPIRAVVDINERFVSVSGSTGGSVTQLGLGFVERRVRGAGDEVTIHYSLDERAYQGTVRSMDKLMAGMLAPKANR